MLRALVKTMLPRFGVEGPDWQEATKAHTRQYVTEERRSQTGCIGGEDGKMILTRALSFWMTANRFLDRCRHRLLAPVLACGLALPLVAQSDTPAADPVLRYVLIVANNGSQDPALEPLTFADDDGLAYYRLFGLFSQNVDLLTQFDDDTQRSLTGQGPIVGAASKATLYSRLGRIFRQIRQTKAQRSQMVEFVFVYVGHGSVDDEGKGYVHLQDGVLTRAELYRDIVAASPADYNHLLVDACRAFSLVAGRGGGEGRRTSGEFRKFLNGHDLERYPNTGVLLASSENRETHEWSKIGAGVFSHQVRSALVGAADVNGDGAIEYSEVAAFVDAANSQLQQPQHRVTVFAWPPAGNRHAALVHLGSAFGARYVILGNSLRGRLFVESQRGTYWAELHKDAGHRIVMALPAAEDFYLRDGRHELRLNRGEEALSVDAPPTKPYMVSKRGAVDSAFGRSIFAVPFGPSYYRGFISGYRHLLPVDSNAKRLVLKSTMATAKSYTWGIGFGYCGGGSLVVPSFYEQGAFVRGVLPLWQRFELQLGMEAGYRYAETSNASVVRFAVTPGLAYRWVFEDRIAAIAGMDVGYALIAITAKEVSGDSSIALVRARLGLSLRLVEGLWLDGGVSGAAYLLTIQSVETIRGRPEFTVGLLWRTGQ